MKISKSLRDSTYIPNYVAGTGMDEIELGFEQENSTTKFFKVKGKSCLNQQIFQEDWQDAKGEYRIKKLNDDTVEMLCDNMDNNPSKSKLKITFGKA